MSNYRQQFENLKPEEIRYTHGQLHIRNVSILVDNAKLSFIECLEEFMERNVYDTLKTGTRIHLDTIIGEEFNIGCNCTIGGYGFGYIRIELGLKRMPHLGQVKIGDNVTIHNNVNIDRGTVGSTTIGNGSAIDSGVHIGHNAHIGSNVLIAANATIGGSAIIEDEAFIGCNAFIKQHVKVGKGATVGAGSVVLKDIPPHAVVAGVPAKPIK
jgi:UDP-3-O-[3-hydroxymyristoyl] glucosamine N-acyltransferase